MSPNDSRFTLKAVFTAVALLCAAGPATAQTEGAQFEGLVRAAAKGFNQALVTGSGEEALRGEPLAESIRPGMASQFSKAAAAHGAAARSNIRYTRASFDVKITDTKVEGDRATVKALVENRRAMAGPTGTPPEARVTEAHVFEFTRQNGRWVLSKDQLVLPWQPPYGNPVDSAGTRSALPADAVPLDFGTPDPNRPKVNRSRAGTSGGGAAGAFSFASYSRNPALGAPKPAVYGTYSQSAALAYKRQWVWGFNPDYRRYDGVGGDCTNFVSQVLRAGGWSDVSGYYTSDSAWWYNFANQSRSWAGAQNMYNFIRYSGRASHASYLIDFIAGDIVQFRLGDYMPDAIHHTAVVDAVDGNGTVWIAYHSGPAEYELLSTFLAKHPGSTTYGWMIFDSY